MLGLEMPCQGAFAVAQVWCETAGLELSCLVVGWPPTMRKTAYQSHQLLISSNCIAVWHASNVPLHSLLFLIYSLLPGGTAADVPSP